MVMISNDSDNTEDEKNDIKNIDKRRKHISN